ncbi:citrate lyase holo-[acyl-carrier protein] synthase [Proteiniclasticum sp. C24MP]|uniref:citrate lyase holo-[acyl-carrier protein] synthase n=1 Tax=Proteiniclasticum sp. C24MP TaxID=3374101 RepID=UPI00375420CB
MELLDSREKRDLREKALLDKYHGTLLTLRANFPGSEKRHEKADLAVTILYEEVRRQYNPVHEEILQDAEGLIYLLLLKESPEDVKRKALSLEESHPLGRLIDMDVRDEEKIWSRRDFSIPGRKCYLCEDLAVHCVRSQKHPLEDVISHFVRKVDDYLESAGVEKRRK